MEDLDYLQEDFDPKTLKVVQLRSVLNKNNIDYPSNSKKADLVNIFNANLEKIKGSHDENGKDSSITKEDSNGTPGAKHENLSKEDPSDSLNSPLRTTRSSRRKSPEYHEEEQEKGIPIVTSIDSTLLDPEKKHIIEAVGEAVKDEGQSVNTTLTEEDKKTNNFSNENLFQTPTVRAKTSSPRSSTRKRHREEGEADSTKKKKLKSPPIKNSVSKKRTGDLFSEPENSDSDESFSKSILKQVKSPVKDVQNVKSAYKNVQEESQAINKLESSSNVLSLPNTPSRNPNAEKGTQIGDFKHSKNPVLQNLSNTENSLKDEEEEFDKNLEKINNRKAKSEQVSPHDILVSKGLNSELGITVHDSRFQPNTVVAATDKDLEPENLRTEVSPQQQNKYFASELLGNNKSNGKGSKCTTNIPEGNNSGIHDTRKLDIDREGDTREDFQVDESNADLKTVKDDKNLVCDESEGEEEVDGQEEVDNEEKSDKDKQESTQACIGDKIPSKGASVFTIITYMGFWLVLLFSALFCYWYRIKTFQVGFCGHEIIRPTFDLDFEVPNWMLKFGSFLDENFTPSCASCPLHARCYEYLEFACYEDFIEHKPWYFDYSPIVNPHWKKCIADTKKAEKLEIMIDVALDLLRTRNADKNCGNLSKDDFTAGLSVTELHDLLYYMKAAYISDEEFEDLWNRSLVELEREPEIITGIRADKIEGEIILDNQGEKKKENKILRSTAISNLSLKCQIQNTILESAFRHKKYIFGVIFLAILFEWIQFSMNKRSTEKAKLVKIYYEVLRRLKQQYRNSEKSPNLIPKYIGSTQLRDLILTKETNLASKLVTWNRVSKMVELNSNIRSEIIENHGEIMKVWEWVTDIAADDELS